MRHSLCMESVLRNFSMESVLKFVDMRIAPILPAIGAGRTLVSV